MYIIHNKKNITCSTTKENKASTFSNPYTCANTEHNSSTVYLSTFTDILNFGLGHIAVKPKAECRLPLKQTLIPQFVQIFIRTIFLLILFAND